MSTGCRVVGFFSFVLKPLVTNLNFWATFVVQEHKREYITSELQLMSFSRLLKYFNPYPA